MATNLLKWRINSNTAINQFIYRSTSPIDIEALPPPLTVLEPDVDSYRDSNIEEGLSYYYVIGSTNGEVEKFSNVSVVDTDLPRYGPGPQELIGFTETEGYFGEVTSSELITGDALASLVGVTAGTSQNSTTNWLKFFIDDKIVFVSKKNIRHSISWDQLNTANVIDGSRVITIGQYQYRIGLLKGVNPDTSVPFRNGLDVPSGLNSEWNRLMYPVSSDEDIQEDRQKHSQTIDNWANFPQDDSADGLNISVGNGRYSWCQETNPLTPANRVLRGNYSVTFLYSNSSSITNTSYGWRPVLELVTSD